MAISQFLCPWCGGALPEKPGQYPKCPHCASKVYWGGGQPHKSAIAAKDREDNLVRELGRITHAIAANKVGEEELPDRISLLLFGKHDKSADSIKPFSVPSEVIPDDISVSELLRMVQADKRRGRPDRYGWDQDQEVHQIFSTGFGTLRFFIFWAICAILFGTFAAYLLMFTGLHN